MPSPPVRELISRLLTLTKNVRVAIFKNEFGVTFTITLGKGDKGIVVDVITNEEKIVNDVVDALRGAGIDVSVVDKIDDNDVAADDGMGVIYIPAVYVPLIAKADDLVISCRYRAVVAYRRGEIVPLNELPISPSCPDGESPISIPRKVLRLLSLIADIATDVNITLMLLGDKIRLMIPLKRYTIMITSPAIKSDRHLPHVIGHVFHPAVPTHRLLDLVASAPGKLVISSLFGQGTLLQSLRHGEWRITVTVDGVFFPLRPRYYDVSPTGAKPIISKIYARAAGQIPVIADGDGASLAGIAQIKRGAPPELPEPVPAVAVVTAEKFDTIMPSEGRIEFYRNGHVVAIAHVEPPIRHEPLRLPPVVRRLFGRQLLVRVLADGYEIRSGPVTIRIALSRAERAGKHDG